MLRYNIIANNKPFFMMTPDEQYLLVRTRYACALGNLSSALFTPYNVDTEYVKLLRQLLAHYLTILTDQLAQTPSVEETYRDIFIARCKTANLSLDCSIAHTVLAPQEELAVGIDVDPTMRHISPVFF